MKCPRCTHQNPPGVRFCNDYGQRVGTLCPGCNTVNLPQSNLCDQGGQFFPKTNKFFPDEKSSRPCLTDVEKTTPRHSAMGERKYEKVLFSDLSGYTILAQRLDPEEVKEIIARISQNECQVKKTNILGVN